MRTPKLNIYLRFSDRFLESSAKIGQAAPDMKQKNISTLQWIFSFGKFFGKAIRRNYSVILLKKNYVKATLAL